LENHARQLEYFRLYLVLWSLSFGTFRLKLSNQIYVMKRFMAGPILGDLTIIKILPPSDIFHQNTRFPDSSKVIFPSGNSKEFLSSCAVCPLAFYSLGVPHIYWEQGIASIQNLLEAGNNTRWTVICSSLL
jgi:hypothetical protein